MIRPMSCVNCGHSPLVPNPLIPHWHHCPVCDPMWSEHAERITRLLSLDRNARAFAADKRGNPTIGGSRTL